MLCGVSAERGERVPKLREVARCDAQSRTQVGVQQELDGHEECAEDEARRQPTEHQARLAAKLRDRRCEGSPTALVDSREQHIGRVRDEHSRGACYEPSDDGQKDTAEAALGKLRVSDEERRRDSIEYEELDDEERHLRRRGPSAARGIGRYVGETGRGESVLCVCRASNAGLLRTESPTRRAPLRVRKREEEGEQRARPRTRRGGGSRCRR